MSALRALGDLLDGSVEQIARAAADGRTFDRETIRLVSDVWDNNTQPFVAAASARTPWGREQRARRALVWLADHGAQRRAWVEAHADVAGLLPPPAERGFARDYLGHVLPNELPLGSGWDEDYELGHAELRHLLVERRGRRLEARLEVTVPRRFAAVTGTQTAASMYLTVPEVDGIDFSCDLRGPVRLDLTDGSIPWLRAGQVTAYLRDDLWHLWTAGRAADALTPPGPTPYRPYPGPARLHGDAMATAAKLVQIVMLEIRSVRFSPRVKQEAVVRLAEVLSGAGTDLLDVGRRARGRERAARGLVAEWIRRGGPELGPWLQERLADTTRWRNPPLPADRPPSPEDELRMVGFRDRDVTVHLAGPPEPWRLRVVAHREVGRLRVTAEPFAVRVGD